MMRRPLVLMLACSLAVSGCATSDKSESRTGTIAGGAGVGAVAGGILGALVGGRKGALIGAAAGGATGAAAGVHVANKQIKYSAIEAEIAQQRTYAQAATAAAQAQVADSRAQLRNVEAELASLQATRRNKARAHSAATALLERLGRQRTALQSQQQVLATRMAEQKAGIGNIGGVIRKNDDKKREQLAQWQAEIPAMEAALKAMNGEIVRVSAMQSRVEAVNALYS